MSTLTMAPPRFVFFDLGNVILKFDHQIACRQIARLTGVSESKVNEVVFQSDLQTQYESGQISTVEFHREFCQRTDSNPSLEELAHAGSDIFRLNLTAIPIIVQLHKAGVSMGILSNTCPAHWQFIRSHGYAIIESHFRVFALSYELKSMKPAADIYEAAVKMTGLPKEEILFVDDRPENVEGARAYGIDSIHFTSGAPLAKELRARGIGFNY